MELTTHTHQGVEKTKRYGWITKDAPGELLMLNKDTLQMHPSYQRDVIAQKVKEITAAWSWLSCGALIVGRRGGEHWVIDGQHRVLAAKRRSDITHLPCGLNMSQPTGCHSHQHRSRSNEPRSI